ncbi:hypothetical protein [Caulobacter sp. LARHSG274]
MTPQPITTLLDPTGMKADYLSSMPIGAIAMELAKQQTSAAPGIGMIVKLGDAEGLLPFTPWTTLGLAPGQLYELHGELGVQITDVEVTTEIDLTHAAPYILPGPPTGLCPPRLTPQIAQTVADPPNPDRALILAVRSPNQGPYWMGYDLHGNAVSYFSSGKDKTFVFDSWVLVLARAGRRYEIRI